MDTWVPIYWALGRDAIGAVSEGVILLDLPGSHSFCSMNPLKAPSSIHAAATLEPRMSSSMLQTLSTELFKMVIEQVLSQPQGQR